MNPTKPGLTPDLTCWDCGATNRPDARECWLCRRRNWRPTPVPADEASQTPPAPPRTRADRAATALTAITGVAIASFAVYAFVTFVLPVLMFFAMIISMLIALYQVCSPFLNAPR